MPLRDTSGFGQRTAHELIHADFEVAFNLVGMARTESERNNQELATQLLKRAQAMLGEIRSRLDRVPAAQRATYESRCQKLSEAIEQGSSPEFRIGDEPNA